MLDEGYIKYQCHWHQLPAVQASEISGLNRWRTDLYRLGLIGEYENGIGFGNVSLRTSKAGEFLVSGTQTGNIPVLNESHYARVTEFDIEENTLTCRGLTKASSESLTHAVIYESQPHINAVFHVHHQQLWQSLLNQVPTTARNCPYGTPEMAKEMLRLFEQEDLLRYKILVMAGHEEGVITFGKTLDETGQILLKYYGEIG